jgi:hypothetical protein
MDISLKEAQVATTKQIKDRNPYHKSTLPKPARTRPDGLEVRLLSVGMEPEKFRAFAAECKAIGRSRAAVVRAMIDQLLVNQNLKNILEF